MNRYEYTYHVGIPQPRGTAQPIFAPPAAPALPSGLAEVPVSPPAHPRPHGFPSTAQNGTDHPPFFPPCLQHLDSARSDLPDAPFEAQYHSENRSR